MKLNNRDLKKEMDHLKELKDILSEEQYKYSAATIYTTYFLELFKKDKRKFNRQVIVDKVNIMLAKEGIEEVTYNFFRKYNIKEFK